MVESRGHRPSAEDAGFEPARSCPLHAFQACALGHYANPPPSRLSRGDVEGLADRGPRAPVWPADSGRTVSASAIRLGRRPLAWRPSHEPPQGRKAARVSGPWRVRGGSYVLSLVWF